MKIEVVVEIPMGSTWKFEKGGRYGLKLDRPLNQPVPYSYGFVPNTLCEDSDPIDCFLLTDAALPPLVTVDAEIIGVIKCLDGGKRDDKLIAVVVNDCRGYETMGTGIIKHYLETYKIGFEIIEECGRDEAIKVYEDSVKAYREWQDKQPK